MESCPPTLSATNLPHRCFRWVSIMGRHRSASVYAIKCRIRVSVGPKPERMGWCLCSIT